MSEQGAHRIHGATGTEASNGEGTVSEAAAEGDELRHPVLDGSTEYYGEEGHEANPRYGMDDPGLIRHPETGETTPIPEE